VNPGETFLRSAIPIEPENRVNEIQYFGMVFRQGGFRPAIERMHRDAAA
jgi:hypothetical protein